MIWVWVAILLILLCLLLYTKNIIPFLLVVVDFIVIIINLASPIKYYWEIVIFLGLGLFLNLVYYFLRFKLLKNKLNKI